MPEWLTRSMNGGSGGSPLELGERFLAALLLGAAVAAFYRWARRGEEVPPTFQATLVMLATLIAMATKVIDDSVARAFSMVGALSVVRFRTVVKDTQDTAFVIMAVIVGMAVGVDRMVIAVVGLAVLAAAGLVLWPPGRPRGWQAQPVTLSLRTGLSDSVRVAAESALASSAGSIELITAGTARQGAALDFTYRVRLRPGCSLAGVAAELNAIEGVQSVELSRRD
ncbi:hypothetical protein OJF2_34250 [Aquisphaera giovannonii]|uniref:Mg(2+) transport ATPase n=1 Tax=Aquisphaera giovannonii TaxID=406548 RepID=A0A5B9W4G2_9BACT|nr:DUF4956 domain-containing protein [Aquisphaera giovannonii]QEH34880.1 hypothetical protein OJF2_34250 [Aquisphaera giovannonii]